MSNRNLLRMGHPLLLRPAVPVRDLHDPKLGALVTDLFDTMAAHGGAGLAAPQIGVGVRVLVFGVNRNPRYPEAEPIPHMVLINPRIEVLDETTEDGWEGCLSIPGLRGLVPRFRRIRYTATDLEGQPIEREAEGFHARLVQHECDHLDGILYPMRMNDMGRFGFEQELQLAREGDAA